MTREKTLTNIVTFEIGYLMSAVRFLTDAEPISVISATAEVAPNDARIDHSMHATLQFPSDVLVEASTNFGLPNWGPWKLIPSWPKVHVTAHCERGDVWLYNFVQPTFYHHLRVKTRNPDGTETTRTEKVYVGKDGLGVESWTT